MFKRISAFVLVVLFAAHHAAFADEPKFADAKARIEAIYARGEYSTRNYEARWLPDSTGYLRVETVDGFQQLAKYDCATGERSMILGRKELTPTGATQPWRLQQFVVSPKFRYLLLQVKDTTEADSREQYWVFERKTGTMTQIAESIGRLSIEDCFSPDESKFLYHRGRNLYAYDIPTAKAIALTNETNTRTVNTGDDARWSADSSKVVYMRSDSSLVRERPMLDAADPSYPGVRWERFARVGETIASLSVGVAEVKTGTTKWMKLPPAKNGCYIPTLGWAGNSEEVFIERHSRGRDERWFLIGNAATGEIRTAYHETDRAWVDSSFMTNAGWDWLDGGKSFVLISERDGWRHAYVAARDGSTQSLFTPGDYDITERGPTDAGGEWFTFLASPKNATQRYLFRTRIDGKTAPERLTPPELVGTNSYNFSPSGEWAIHTISTFDSPPKIDLVHLPDHKSVRVLEDNAAVRERIKPLIVRPTEFVQLDIGNGINMDAWIITPRVFDASKKYPVFVFIYGEPHGQTVLDDWRGGQGNTMFHRAIADLGYVVVSIDNRGTPAPKGAAWRRAVFGSLGPLSTDEQAEGMQALARMKSYIDLSRVGIWGWSGGGSNTLNALFRKPELYKLGIAVAPKPQPQLYNAWFQEIYMRTPAENADGYKRSAPINFAAGLQGHLLIVHGTGETNTHLQIVEGLVDRLIELGKRFDYFTYPHRDHGLREGTGTPVHLRLMMTRYLLEHLPAGPR